MYNHRCTNIHDITVGETTVGECIFIEHDVTFVQLIIKPHSLGNDFNDFAG